MELLIAIKGWILAAIPAAIGSLLSIFMDRDKAIQMRRWEVFCVFFFGITLAHYLGGAAIEYSHVTPQSFIADGIKFTIGLLGMSSLSSIFAQIPLGIEGLRKKWTGQ